MSTGFWVSYVLLWALAIFSTLVLVGVLRAVYGREQGTSPGASGDPSAAPATRRPAPEIAASDLHGRPFSSDGWGQRRTAVLFVSPDCASCKLTLPQLSALHHKVGGNVVVVCRSTRGRCAQMAEEYDLDVTVLVDTDEEVSARFGVDIAPTAVLIAADGTIESTGHPMGADDLEEMFARRNGGATRDEAALSVVRVAPHAHDDE